MEDVRIQVTLYEGYRGAERPSSLLDGARTVAVVAVQRTWVEEEFGTRKQRRFFTVQGDDGDLYTLYCEIESSEWFLRSRATVRHP
jgi:hypothetical protein